MWHELGRDGEYAAKLLEWDVELAEQVRRQGCGWCGGRLDRADYPRKTRGLGTSAEGAYGRRISFCCARPGCRRRTMPPSVRFLGRKVYAATVVLVASAYAEEARQKAKERRRIRRWRQWWRRGVVASRWWTEARGRLMPPVDEAELPGSLLARFSGSVRDAVGACLRFVAPLTTGSCNARFAMAD